MKQLAALALVASLSLGFGAHARSDSQYLYLWTASADTTQPDYLAVLDVSGGARRLVTTLPVPGHHNGPHHTEYELSRDRQLFANGFASGQTFIFDLTKPAAPRLARQLGDIEGYRHPHSYIPLWNGNRLATFQMRHDSTMRTGGLVELTPAGRVVRSSSADTAGLDPAERVYSAAVVGSLDRIVTTTTDMDPTRAQTREIQVWRLSDLALLKTITLPNGPAGTEGQLTAEPRVLADGRTVLVSTFSCGLYLLEGLDGDTPSGRLVASFPRRDRWFCAVPVVVGHYYLVTVPAWSAVVSLDISDPSKPREVSRATLDTGDVPHWIAVSPDQRRVVVTGYGTLRNRVALLRLDPKTGQLALDGPLYQMDGGIPHGAVFSRP